MLFDTARYVEYLTETIMVVNGYTMFLFLECFANFGILRDTNGKS